jgi:hypothetical protein
MDGMAELVARVSSDAWSGHPWAPGVMTGIALALSCWLPGASVRFSPAGALASPRGIGRLLFTYLYWGSPVRQVKREATVEFYGFEADGGVSVCIEGDTLDTWFFLSDYRTAISACCSIVDTCVTCLRRPRYFYSPLDLDALLHALTDSGVVRLAEALSVATRAGVHRFEFSDECTGDHPCSVSPDPVLVDGKWYRELRMSPCTACCTGMCGEGPILIPHDCTEAAVAVSSIIAEFIDIFVSRLTPVAPKRPSYAAMTRPPPPRAA